jgi:hypothetical protein
MVAIRFRASRLGAAVAAVAVAITACALAGAGSAAAASTPAAVWGPAHTIIEAPGLGSFLDAAELTCYGVGDCLAAGTDNTDPYPSAQQAVATEANGVWGKANLISSLTTLALGKQDQIEAVSCASPGNCAAGGWYFPAYGEGGTWSLPFLVSERGGKWGQAQDPPDLAALNPGADGAVTSITCTGPGDCLAGGFYAATSQRDGKAVVYGAFVIDQRNWIWGKPVTLTRSAYGGVSAVSAVSCTSPGNCAAAGNTNHAFSARETNFAWHSPTFIDGMSMITLLSCPAAGDCAAAGDAVNAASSSCRSNPETCTAAYVTEKDGAWGAPRTVLDPADAKTRWSALSALSCGSPGNCVAGGSTYTYSDSVGDANHQEFLLEEKNGRWGNRPIPGLAALNKGGEDAVSSASCTEAGDCEAGGYYTNSHGRQYGFLLTEANGTWRKLAPVDVGPVGAISCFSPASCAALVSPGIGTLYGANSAVMDKEAAEATKTVLSLSGGRLAYGHEQAEHISVRVTAKVGDPAGAVVVESGSTTVCVIGLIAGKGSCALSSAALPAGTHAVTAHYLGESFFKASSSAAKTIIVVKT